jgi:hypothetical protein
MCTTIATSRKSATRLDLAKDFLRKHSSGRRYRV